MRMHANRREDVKEIRAGDIGAAVGLRRCTTGDTLCDPAAPIELERLDIPEPVIGIAIEPETADDQDKLSRALAKLANEDPSFRVTIDPNSMQTIISGMGELHLDILVDRLAREYQVSATVGKPQVAYRETIRSRVEVDKKHIKQVGGRGQYGHVKIVIEPAKRGTGIEFVNAISGGSVPKEYIPAIEAGVRESAQRGVLAGYPMVDIKVTLVDGSANVVDSSEMAFKTVGSLAFQEGVRRAAATILEPLMSIDIVVPDEFVGDVVGDFNARRGKISGIEPRLGVQVVAGHVPLATMFGYATDLRSRTQGRATFSMQFSHYSEVPVGIRDEVVAKVSGSSIGKSLGKSTQK